MLLTIVIPTYNRAQVLARLLESLREQSDPEFEVVVAIDGSTDDTDAVLAGLDLPYPLRWVNTHCPGYGLAVARNRGILEARGELVALIDDDCFPATDYVRNLKASAKRKVITGGPRTPADGSETAQHAKMKALAELPPCEPLAIPDLRRRFPRAVLTEVNICLFREDFIALGLFSESLKIYGFIGQEFFARAAHLGFCYQYDPSAGMVHLRQVETGTGMTDRRKKRQILVARALHVPMFVPRQFARQVAWARESARRYPELLPPPGVPLSAWLQFPYRFARNRAADVRRALRRRRAAPG